jgi:hypothetical protein
LYGELLPDGVTKALGAEYLAAGSADTALELGMGTGKVALQAFLEFDNLTQIMGIELTRSRYILPQDALLRLVKIYPSAFKLDELNEGVSISISTCEGPRRCLTFRCGDMLEIPAEELQNAQIVMLEVCLPRVIWEGVSRLLNQLSDGTRILSLHDLCELWSPASLVCPFHQREVNKSITDTFKSSWSESKGHHFFCYAKDVTLPQSVFPHAARTKQDDGSCGSGADDSSSACGSEQGGGLAEAAMMFPAGTPVEVMYSFWPSDDIFLNGDWYKGWVQGCHASRAAVNVALDDGQSGHIGTTEPVYTILYADGDVSENVPHQHIRAGSHGLPGETEEREDEGGGVGAVGGAYDAGQAQTAQVQQLQSEVDWG